MSLAADERAGIGMIEDGVDYSCKIFFGTLSGWKVDTAQQGFL